MNVLFCCEGFLIDGVASYNLHMAAALRAAGHRVAILGRWLGFHGYQSRHRQTGVEVLQYVSPVVLCKRAVELGRAFAPDVIITDARRAYPLAMEIHRRYGVPIITNFMDDPIGKDKPGRTLDEIRDNSVAWVSPEPNLAAAASALSPGIPVRQVRRAVMPKFFPASPLPPRDPFRILCLGRLSTFKFRGQRTIVQNAPALKKAIPTLEITVVGGGWRQWVFKKDAVKAGLSAGTHFVRIAGYQMDPSPWIAAATVVCGGSTCGLETILSNRPVIAMSGFWFGTITPENLDEAIEGYYAERGGHFLLSKNPGVVLDEIVDLYENWEGDDMRERTRRLRERMLPEFSPDAAARDWQALLDEVL